MSCNVKNSNEINRRDIELSQAKSKPREKKVNLWIAEISEDVVEIKKHVRSLFVLLIIARPSKRESPY